MSSIVIVQSRNKNGAGARSMLAPLNVRAGMHTTPSSDRATAFGCAIDATCFAKSMPRAREGGK
jgi:hypothetical protein